MNAGIGSARAEAAPRAARPGIARGLLLAAGALLAAATFHGITLGTSALGAYDWIHHFHYYDWIRIALTRHGTLPLYMGDALHTSHFLANPMAPLLGPLVGSLLFLPTVTYVKTLLVLYCAAGLLGMLALLREAGASWEAALLAAVLFAFNGFFAAHVAVGHFCFFGVWLLPALFFFFRRAVAGDVTALWCAAALNVVTIFEGFHHPFVWQVFALVLYGGLLCVQQRSLGPAAVTGGLLLLTLGLGAAKLLPMLAEFGAYAPQVRTGGMSPGALAFSLLARGQDDATRFAGVAFDHGSGWWEYAYYGGLATPLLLALSVASVRRHWPLVALGLFFLLLALRFPLGGVEVEPWRWIADLPGWRTQRMAPRFFVVALFALSAAGALGLQRIVDAARRRPRLQRALYAAITALALLAALDLQQQSRSWQRIGPAQPPAARDHAPDLALWPAAPQARVSVQRFDGSELVVEVRSPIPTRLVLRAESERSLAQWSARGGELEAVQGRVGVRVAAGDTTLTLRYEPRLRAAGLFVSALVALAGAATWMGRRARRRGAAPGRRGDPAGAARASRGAEGAPR